MCLFIVCAALPPPPPPCVPGTTSLRQWMQAWATFAKQRIRRRRLVTKSTRAGNRLLLRRAFDEWKRVRSYTRRVSRAASQRARCAGGVARDLSEVALHPPDRLLVHHALVVSLRPHYCTPLPSRLPRNRLSRVDVIPFASQSPIPSVLGCCRYMVRTAFREWRAVVQRVAKARRLMRSVLGSITASCFQKWAQLLVARRRRVAMTRSQSFVKRLVNRCAGPVNAPCTLQRSGHRFLCVFRCLCLCVHSSSDDAPFSHVCLSPVVFARFDHAAMETVMRAWRAAVAANKRTRNLLFRWLRRTTHGAMKRAWMRWVEATTVCVCVCVRGWLRP